MTTQATTLGYFDGDTPCKGTVYTPENSAGVNMPEAGALYNASTDRRSWQAMRSFLAEVL